MKDDARQLLEFADYKVEMQRKVQGLEADNLWLRSEVERLKRGKAGEPAPAPVVDAELIVVPTTDAAPLPAPVKRSKRG